MGSRNLIDKDLNQRTRRRPAMATEVLVALVSFQTAKCLPDGAYLTGSRLQLGENTVGS